MIPSRLNLLSPEKRQHLKNMVFFQFIKGILEVLLIIACAAGIILLGARTILENFKFQKSKSYALLHHSSNL